MLTMYLMQGKVALITRGDFGIGRAMCYYFAQEGPTIAFTYVKGGEEEGDEDTLQKIKELKMDEAKDPIAAAIAADTGYDENCKTVVDQTVESYGWINKLVNNAAKSRLGGIEEMTEDGLVRMFKTNIFSYFFVTRQASDYNKFIN